MEKLASKVRMAERQVARRLEKKNKPNRLTNPHHPDSAVRRNLRFSLAMARTARREDWELGPLAPNRDTPSLTMPAMRKPLRTALRSEIFLITPPIWGAVDRDVARPTFVPTKELKEARWKWAGGTKTPCLAPGDRVVVMEGSYKGHISKIKDIGEDTATLTLENGGEVNMRIPDYLPIPSKATVQAMPASIPISAVRLVHPIKDPETGKTRDVIIRELVSKFARHDRITGSTTWARVVPGLNVQIPWPAHVASKHVEHPCDTPRMEVEKKTFVPSLLRPPMPESVLDELRNRFSKFRTRHTDEYVAQVAAEVEAKRLKHTTRNLGPRTPLQELNKAERDARRAKGQPTLSDDMLAKIGEVMAKNQARVMKSAGISRVVPTATILPPPPPPPTAGASPPPS